MEKKTHVAIFDINDALSLPPPEAQIFQSVKIKI